MVTPSGPFVPGQHLPRELFSDAEWKELNTNFIQAGNKWDKNYLPKCLNITGAVSNEGIEKVVYSAIQTIARKKGQSTLFLFEASVPNPEQLKKFNQLVSPEVLMQLQPARGAAAASAGPASVDPHAIKAASDAAKTAIAKAARAAANPSDMPAQSDSRAASLQAFLMAAAAAPAARAAAAGKPERTIVPPPKASLDLLKERLKAAAENPFAGWTTSVGSKLNQFCHVEGLFNSLTPDEQKTLANDFVKAMLDTKKKLEENRKQFTLPVNYKEQLIEYCKKHLHPLNSSILWIPEALPDWVRNQIPWLDQIADDPIKVSQAILTLIGVASSSSEDVLKRYALSAIPVWRSGSSYTWTTLINTIDHVRPITPPEVVAARTAAIVAQNNNREATLRKAAAAAAAAPAAAAASAAAPAPLLFGPEGQTPIPLSLASLQTLIKKDITGLLDASLVKMPPIWEKALNNAFVAAIKKAKTGAVENGTSFTLTQEQKEEFKTYCKNHSVDSVVRWIPAELPRWIQNKIPWLNEIANDPIRITQEIVTLFVIGSDKSPQTALMAWKRGSLSGFSELAS